HLARILALSGRTKRTVRDRDTVGGAHAAEAPALHAARKALALRVAGNIDQLPGHEMRSRDRRADFEHRIFGDAEFGDLLLEGHFGLREMFALRLGDVLLLGFARAQLEGGVTVLLSGTDRNHLAIFQRKNG